MLDFGQVQQINEEDMADSGIPWSYDVIGQTREKRVQIRHRLATIPPRVAPDRAPPTVIGKLERALSRLASANADSLA